MNHEQLLTEHRSMETEGERSPAGPFVLRELEDTIDIEILALQRLLDVSRFKRLMSITPQQFGYLDQVERRNLLRAARGFQKRFDEVTCWMSRNTADELEVPVFLKAGRA